MEALKEKIMTLPTITVGNQTYIAYQAVTDIVVAFLFPALPSNQIDEAEYQSILETAAFLCRELGYSNVGKLMPPDVSVAQTGLYFCIPPPKQEMEIIMAGPGRMEEL